MALVVVAVWFINVLCRSVSWLALLMVVLTSAVVVLRWFGFGSIALQEVSGYAHAALFMLGASYALIHDAHVRVDVFYRNWSPRTQAMVDIAGTILLLAPTCIFLLYSSTPYALKSWRILEGSAEAGGLPGVFLLKTLIPAMAAMLLVAGFSKAKDVYREMRKMRSQP